jgi:predicted transglutaminase-like cysteine proteinase
MKTILRNYYLLILLILFVSFAGKLAFAEPLPPALAAIDPISKKPVTFVGIPIKNSWTSNSEDLAQKWAHLNEPTAETKKLWSGISPAQDPLSLVGQVNEWVNSHLKFQEDVDLPNGNNGDQWSSVNESLKRGYGDCDDNTIAKYQILKSLGFPEDNMYFIVGRDLVSQQIHAFLALKIHNQYFVLDNLRSEVFTDVRVVYTVFFPILAYSGNKTWLFGIRKN